MKPTRATEHHLSPPPTARRSALALATTAVLFLAFTSPALALAPPTVTTTEDATAVTLTSATVAGSVNPNSADVTNCHVEYGPSAPAYGLQQPCATLPGNGSSAVDVHADLTGLEPLTVYHFRLLATNGAGTTAGPDRTFISDPDFPSSTLGVHPELTESFGLDGQPLTYAHAFSGFADGANFAGSTPQGSLDHPCGVAVDSRGFTYLATAGSNLVSVFRPDGFGLQYVTQFAAAANAAPPCGLAVDSLGVVYVNGRDTDVYRYAPSSYPPVGSPPASVTTYDSGTPVDTGHGSTAVAVNPADDHVFVDDKDHVVEYDSAANSNSLIDATIGQGIITDSYGLDVYAENGDVYVNDETTRKVYVLNPAGDTVLQAIDGTGVPTFPVGFGSLQGQGLAVDQSNGHVLVADVKDHAVVDEFTPAGGYRDQLSGSLLDSEPTDLAVDNSGEVHSEYVYVTSGSGPAGTLRIFQPRSPNGFGSDIANLAIDQASHRLYVLSRIGFTASVSAFDISTPAAHTPIGGGFPLTGAGIATGGHHDIAVDQTLSPSPTAGNLYAVTDSGAGSESIHGWRPDGTPLSPSSGWPAFPLAYPPKNCAPGESTCQRPGFDATEAAGDAVDPDGNVWVANRRNCGYEHRYGEIDQYDPLSGKRISFVDVHEQGDVAHNQLGCAAHVDFDADRNMYVAFATLFGPGSTAGVWKYPAAADYVTASRFDPQSAYDLSVDRSTAIVYTVHGDGEGDVAIPGVDAYGAGGGLFERFATDVPSVFSRGGTFEPQVPGITDTLAGIAIDESTGTVYVADQSSGGRVLVFRGVRVPTVGAIADLTQSSATVNGHLEPETAPDFTDCRVEYVADATFAATGYADLLGPGPSLAGSRPCDGAPPYGKQYVSAALDGLAYGTAFHYRLLATNANGTVRGSDHTFETDPAVYDVQTHVPSDLTQRSATLNGSFRGDGHEATFHFQWGLDTTYGNETPELPAPVDTGTVSVAAAIDDLTTYAADSEPYHYRLVVTNDVGTTYGPDRAFLTLPPAPPQIVAGAASGLSPSSATLSASVKPNLGDTVYRFQYGTDASYSAVTPTSDPIGRDDVEHQVSTVLTGLQPATTYHFRVLATNFGGTSRTPDQTFTTPDFPRIDASFASAVAMTTAHLGAQAVPNADPTAVHFEYGTSSAYGASTPDDPIGSGLFARDSGADLSRLAPATTYHFRAVAVNGVGTTHGPDQTFTTIAETIVASPPCGKGFVKRHGRCVKRPNPHRKHKHHKRKHHRRGNR